MNPYQEDIEALHPLQVAAMACLGVVASVGLSLLLGTWLFGTTLNYPGKMTSPPAQVAPAR